MGLDRRANRADLGHKYTSWMAPRESGEDELQAVHASSAGKRMVHTTVALTAADQLRQRVAWALSQIFVIGENGLMDHTQEHEIWHSK